MAGSGAQIAALVARASRHRALLRRVRAAGVFIHNTRVVCDVPGAQAWRTGGAIRSFATPSGKPPARPSLAISEAFGDDDDNDDSADGAEQDDELSFGFDLDGDDQGDEEDDVLPAVRAVDIDEHEDEADTVALDASALSADEQRELAQRLRFAMDRKKQWMQRLAARGALDALLKVVYECYEPLYATHAALQRAPCPLWQAYEDAEAVADVETKYKPKWYDDQVTKITEQEAMALFVTTARRPDLAMAVFRHREWLAAQIGSVTLSRGDDVLADVTVEFGKHFRSFYSWAMGASTALNDHAQVFAIYENGLENGVFPTANMTQAYLNSLIAKREFEAVAALFAQIQKDDRPTNLYFYRQMLFAARVTGDSKTADVVLKEMKIKGFKVRAEDYLNALRSLDTQYYLRRGDNAKTTTKQDDHAPVLWLDESYRECVARVADQESSPDAYASREKASGNVIKLFEEMVEDEQIPPHSEAFFPRVISAALFLHDYDRVTEYGALYVRCFNKPLADAGAIKMTVNALLVKDEPTAALELVFQALKDKSLKHKKRVRDSSKPVLTVLSAIGNIVEYLASHQETALVLELLASLDAKRLMGAALTPSPALSQMLLNTLVRDTQTVSNEQLWEVLATKYWMVFPVAQNTKALTQLVDACISADRWWLISKVLHKRNRKAIPHLPARIALQLSKKGLEDTSDPERVEMVAHLANMVDIAAMGAEARVAFCCNVVRALHVLRHDSSRGLHRQREISRLHDQFLRGKGISLPSDVREILLANA